MGHLYILDVFYTGTLAQVSEVFENPLPPPRDKLNQSFLPSPLKKIQIRGGPVVSLCLDSALLLQVPGERAMGQ